MPSATICVVKHLSVLLRSPVKLYFQASTAVRQWWTAQSLVVITMVPALTGSVPVKVAGNHRSVPEHYVISLITAPTQVPASGHNSANVIVDLWAMTAQSAKDLLVICAMGGVFTDDVTQSPSRFTSLWLHNYVGSDKSLRITWLFNLHSRSCLCRGGWTGPECDICIVGKCETLSVVLYILPTAAGIHQTDTDILVYGNDLPLYVWDDLMIYMYIYLFEIFELTQLSSDWHYMVRSWTVWNEKWRYLFHSVSPLSSSVSSKRYTCLYGSTATDGFYISSSLIRCRIPEMGQPGRYLFNIVPYGSDKAVPFLDKRLVNSCIFRKVPWKLWLRIISCTKVRF